jgi:histidine triad (HIT) family protein
MRTKQPDTRPIGGDDCLLCLLTSRQVEVSVVHEDERTVTLMDIQPVVRGHMLVVPRRHVASLVELDEGDGAQLLAVAQLATAALHRSKLRCEGVNLFLADGKAAGQEVFHVHLHVIPRFVGDGFGLRFPPGYSVRPRVELEQAAEAVRSAWSGHRLRGRSSR